MRNGLLFIAFALLQGCGTNVQNDPQRIHVRLVPATEPVVVMEETVHVRGQVDSSSGETFQLRRAQVTLGNAGRFTTDVPEVRSFGIAPLWYYEYDDQRFTVFAPGHALVTVYPEAFTNIDPDYGRIHGGAAMGWRANKYRPISSHNSLPIGNSFDPLAHEVTLEVPLRPLRPSAAKAIDSPFLGTTPPPELCDADAMTFTDQIKALAEVMRTSPQMSSDAKKVVWVAIKSEYDALDGSGFGALLPASGGLLMVQLRASLGVVDAQQARGTGQVPLRRLGGSGGSFVQFSDDGRRLLTVGHDHARMWNLADGKAICDPIAVSQPTPKRGWAKLARDVLLVRLKSTVGIRDARTAKLLRSVPFEKPPEEIDLSPDGAYFAVSQAPQTVTVFRTADGSKVVGWTQWGQDEGKVRQLVFSPDSKSLLVLTENLYRGFERGRWLHLRDVASGKEQFPPIRYEYTYVGQDAGFSPDGRWIAMPEHNSFYLLDAATGKKLEDSGEFAVPGVDSGHVESVVFSRDGRKLLTVGGPWCRLWSVGPVRPASDHLGVSIWDAAFDKTGERFIAAGPDEAAGIWHASTGKRLKVVAPGFPDCVAVSPDGTLAALGYPGHEKDVEYTDLWEIR